MTRIVDVHNHLYPKEWLDYLGARKNSPRMERRDGMMVLYSQSTIGAHVIHPGHYDPEERVKDLDRCGIDTQIMSLTIPSVEELPVEEGVKWARKINDYFADVCQKHPERLYACATLPFQDVAESVKELERAYKELGVKGITLFSNINFKPISSPEFDPIYAKAEEYHLPILIHPAVPFTDDMMHRHGISPALYGFTLDTSTAVVSLIWRGVLERHPGLRIVHAHLGGVVPYLVQRMEDCWKFSSKPMGLSLSKSPSEYYRAQVYPDSMSSYPPAIRCCLEFVGPSHICLGTDYAHGIGNWDRAVSSIRELGLSREDTDRILGENGSTLFRLK